MKTSIFLACLAMGVAMEVVSSQFNLWVYQRPWLRIISIALVFGLAFGWLSTIVAEQSLLVRFAAGAAVGIAYEAANLLFLHLFSFQEPLSLLRSRVVVILSAGVPWGLLPVAAPPLARLVFG